MAAQKITLGARLFVGEQKVEGTWKGITVFGWTRPLLAWTAASLGVLLYPSEVHYTIRGLALGFVGTRVVTDKVAGLPWQHLKNLIPEDVEVRQTDSGFEVMI